NGDACLARQWCDPDRSRIGIGGGKIEPKVENRRRHYVVLILREVLNRFDVGSGLRRRGFAPGGMGFRGQFCTAVILSPSCPLCLAIAEPWQAAISVPRAGGSVLSSFLVWETAGLMFVRHRCP